jgi:predicted secreted Zn-dependent protease
MMMLCFNHVDAQQQKEVIEWKEGSRLNWEDFKGGPPESAKNAALTSSRILINFHYSQNALQYAINCQFDKNRSWVRVRNEHILAHEQGHFDITEVHARKLNKAMKEYRFRPASVSKDVNEIYQRIVNELQEMQNTYDRETDHSRNFPQQREWEQKIKKELDDFKLHRNYERS